jgi:hypothetical protein
VATAAEHGISKRTIERSLAKAEGRSTKPKRAANVSRTEEVWLEGHELKKRKRQTKAELDHESFEMCIVLADSTCMSLEKLMHRGARPTDEQAQRFKQLAASLVEIISEAQQ